MACDFNVFSYGRCSLKVRCKKIQKGYAPYLGFRKKCNGDLLGLVDHEAVLFGLVFPVFLLISYSCHASGRKIEKPFHISVFVSPLPFLHHPRLYISLGRKWLGKRKSLAQSLSYEGFEAAGFLMAFVTDCSPK